MSVTSSSSFGGYRNQSLQSSNARAGDSDLDKSRNTSRVHWLELSNYLSGKADGTQQRSNAREKLQRLTRTQFQELSTDVYDELLRRKKGDDLSVQQEPFLVSQAAFHPKRNQARQKLATLPTSRFKDLASDVLFELERRYPEFKEEEVLANPMAISPTSNLSTGKRPMSPPSNNLSAQAMSAMAANEVLVPNKSTLVEEEIINKPSARPFSPPFTSPTGGYEESPMSPQSMRGHSQRASEASSVARQVIGGYRNQDSAGQQQQRAADQDLIASLREELSSSKQNYEYQLTSLQSRLAGLERDLSDSQREHSRSREKMKEVEYNLRNVTDAHQEQSDTIQAHLQEIASLKASQSTLMASSTNMKDKDNLINQLQQDLEESNSVNQDLKAEIANLIEELQGVNRQLEESITDREALQNALQDKDALSEDWKKQYQQAKTDLRNVKATSQMYAPEQNSFKPTEDYFPPSEDGVIQDVHLTAYQAAVTALLAAARTNSKMTVLKTTNEVVTTVSQLDEDVQAFENSNSFAHFSENDREHLANFKSKCHATLSNVVTAAKNHATSTGLSPVSLVDAACSHLTVTIIDMVKLLKLRKGPFRDFETNGKLNGDTSSLNTNVGPSSNMNGVSSFKDKMTSPALSFGAQRGYGANGNHQTQSPASNYSASPQIPLNQQLARNVNGSSSGVTIPPRLNSGHQKNTSYSSLQQDPQMPLSSTSTSSFGGPSNAYETPQLSNQYGHKPSDSIDRMSDYGQQSPNAFEYSEQGNSGNQEEGVPLTEEEWYNFKEFLSGATTDIVRDIQKLLASLRSRDEHALDDLPKIISTVSYILTASREHLPFVDSNLWDLNCLETLQMESEKLTELQERTQGKSMVYDKTANSQVTQATYQIVKAMKALNVMFEDKEDDEIR